MAVAAQFDVDAAAVADLRQSCHHLSEINLAFAEHQVVVDAVPHVFDMDVPQPIAPTPQMHGDGGLSQTMQMANVDCQTEERMPNPLMQLRKARHRIDEHPWLRLEGQA